MVQVTNEGGPVGSKTEVNREQNVMTCGIYLQSINSIAYRKIWEKMKELTHGPSVSESTIQWESRRVWWENQLYGVIMTLFLSSWGVVNAVLFYFTLLQTKPKVNSVQTLILNYISAPYPSFKNTESEDLYVMFKN